LDTIEQPYIREIPKPCYYVEGAREVPRFAYHAPVRHEVCTFGIYSNALEALERARPGVRIVCELTRGDGKLVKRYQVWPALEGGAT